jgi:peptidoglycan/xylan/chitin deacetylase (PgdA/CDA1 family)
VGLVPSWAEQVIDQAGQAAAALADLANHWRMHRRTSSASWSRS